MLHKQVPTLELVKSTLKVAAAVVVPKYGWRIILKRRCHTGPGRWWATAQLSLMLCFWNFCLTLAAAGR